MSTFDLQAALEATKETGLINVSAQPFCISEISKRLPAEVARHSWAFIQSKLERIGFEGSTELVETLNGTDTPTERMSVFLMALHGLLTDDREEVIMRFLYPIELWNRVMPDKTGMEPYGAKFWLQCSPGESPIDIEFRILAAGRAYHAFLTTFVIVSAAVGVNQDAINGQLKELEKRVTADGLGRAHPDKAAIDSVISFWRDVNPAVFLIEDLRLPQLGFVRGPERFDGRALHGGEGQEIMYQLGVDYQGLDLTEVESRHQLVFLGVLPSEPINGANWSPVAVEMP